MLRTVLRVLPTLIVVAIASTPIIVAADSNRTTAQDPSAPPSPPAIRGTVVPTTMYGLAFGRNPAIVAPTSSQSGVSSPGQWVVDAVDVQLGDVVTAGETLATADKSSAQLQVDAAQTALDAAQAKLDADLAKPTQRDTASADSALGIAAQTARAASLAVGDTFRQSRTTLHGAKKNLRLQESGLRAASAAGLPAVAISSSRRAVTLARIALKNSRAGAAASNHRVRQAAIAARLALVAARAAHERAVAPSSDSVIAADRSALAAAQLNLSKATDALNGAQITSPVDGVVTAITITPGAVAGVGDAIQVIESPMEVIAHIPEALINSTVVGQPVTVTVPAAPATIDGTVATVSSKPDSAAGTVTYPATITLTSPPDSLRVGMTANVETPTP
jgi:multidrug efflux pump subunit AcrA (membrane-fusion protein)